MNVRLVVTKPTKRAANQTPLNGILFYKDGYPVGTVVVQTRRNKQSMWETVEVVDE